MLAPAHPATSGNLAATDRTAYNGHMPKSLLGECLCRTIQYTVLDEFEYALNCHCSQCRRATGSAFKPLAGIPLSKLKFLRGHDDRWIFGDKVGAHDVRCAQCGSLLYSVIREGAYAHVAMGTLVDEPSIRPSMHIFTGSRAAWHQITDDLPSHVMFPPA